MATLDDNFQELIERLRQWDSRRRRSDALLWLPRGLLAGLMAAALFASAARFRPFLFNRDVALLALVLASFGLLISAIIVLFKRRSLLEQARFADRQFQLLERSSTTVEIRSGRILTTPLMTQQQLEDTVRTMADVDVKGRLPLRLNRRDIAVVLLAAALILVGVWLPNPMEQTLAEDLALEESIEEQVEALEGAEEDIRQNEALTAEQQEELLAPIQSALEQLRAQNLSRELAVATLSEAAAELRELSDTYDTGALRQSLTGAAEPLLENSDSRIFGQALQNGQLSAASSALSQLADELPGLDSDEMAQLASDLSETAASLEDVDPELASELSEAVHALQSGDTSGAQEALRDAAATLQQRAQERSANQQATTAAGQLDQSRQAVAQAGQPASTGQGSGESGQGQDQEGGSGQPGQGQGQAQGTDQGENVGGPGPGGGHADNVFVPALADLSGEEGLEVELPAECAGNPENCGFLISESPSNLTDEQSLVPYHQVFGDYRNAAYQALESDYIPLGLKGYVRDYFSSLEP